MATTGSSSSVPSGERMYSKVIDDETNFDEFNRRPDVDNTHAHPLAAIRTVAGGFGVYRLATVCLAALCVILFISLIAVSAKNKDRQQGGGVLPSATDTQNISALTETIRLLQRDKSKMAAEREELLARIAVLNVTKESECPLNWQQFESHCYLISSTSRGWYESKSFCQSQGAYLAVVHTAEEQIFIWNQLPRGHWNGFWIGLTNHWKWVHGLLDPTEEEWKEDEWKWVDGTTLEVRGFWEEREPNNHIIEDCVCIVKTQVMERLALKSWSDAPCSKDQYCVCEKDMGPGASTALPH